MSIIVNKKINYILKNNNTLYKIWQQEKLKYKSKKKKQTYREKLYGKTW